MSHHDKKFENESQDARRRDQYKKVHMENGEHIIKPSKDTQKHLKR